MVATNGMTTVITPGVATRTEVEMEGVDTEEVNKTFSTAPVLISVRSSFCCELEEENSNRCVLKKFLHPQATVVEVTTRVAGAIVIAMEVLTHAVDIAVTSSQEEATVGQLLTTKEDTTRFFILILPYKVTEALLSLCDCVLCSLAPPAELRPELQPRIQSGQLQPELLWQL